MGLVVLPRSDIFDLISFLTSRCPKFSARTTGRKIIDKINFVLRGHIKPLREQLSLAARRLRNGLRRSAFRLRGNWALIRRSFAQPVLREGPIVKRAMRSCCKRLWQRGHCWLNAVTIRTLDWEHSFQKNTVDTSSVRASLSNNRSEFNTGVALCRAA